MIDVVGVQYTYVVRERERKTQMARERRCMLGCRFPAEGGVPLPVRMRLARTGAKKRPSYRVVIADARAPRDGKTIDILGYYNPLTDPAEVRIDAERARDWLRKGAQPTERVQQLLVRTGVIEPPHPRPQQEPAAAESEQQP